MLYRSIRGLKKKVSALSIGSWSTFERMEFEDIIDVLGTCLEGGVNLIDDCRYGHQPGVPAGIPTTEVIVGQALKALGVGRDTYMLATKLWWDKYPRLTLRQQLLQAMRRLDVQHIELVYVDRPDRFVEAHPAAPFDFDALTVALAQEMGELVSEGIIEAYGIANSNADAIVRICGTVESHGLMPPSVAQMRFNLAETAQGEAPALKSLCASSGLMLAATMPLAGGLLTGKYLVDNGEPRRWSDDFVAARASEAKALSVSLLALAREIDVPTSELAIAYPLAQAHVGTVVFGARTTAQVAQNLLAVNLIGTPALSRLAALAG